MYPRYAGLFFKLMFNFSSIGRLKNSLLHFITSAIKDVSTP